jgi:competence protein ComEA
VQTPKNLRLWVAAAAVVALILGYALPRHPNGTSMSSLTRPLTEATVPGQLLAGELAPSATPFASPAPPTEVAVYICGDVHHPGVYRFASNLRVADGIARAGGALPDADLEQLNLAQPLSDAMKIDVPKKGEHVIADAALGIAPGPTTPYGHRRASRHSGRSSHKLQPGQTLDVNTASESELTSLPGVGPSLARRIVEYRTENGPFQSVDDLQNVSGIGASKFDRMAPFIHL